MSDVLVDPALSTMTCLVACRLALFLDIESGRCSPSISMLARGTATTNRTAERAISRLEARGWIAKQSGGGRATNSYSLLLKKIPKNREDLRINAMSLRETMH